MVSVRVMNKPPGGSELMEVKRLGELFQNSGPRSCKLPWPVEAQCIRCTKNARELRRWIIPAFRIKKRSHFLCCECARCHSIAPPQPINVAGQTFTPDRLQ